MQTAKRIGYVLFITALILPFSLFVVAIAYFSGMPSIIPLIFAVHLSIGTLLAIQVFEVEQRKKLFYRLIIGVIGVMLVIAIPSIYSKLVPVVADGYVDISVYEPFAENSQVVKLDGPSTLTLTDDLPIIDGATALYPIYAAFAHAVYPEKDYFQHDSEVMVNRTNEAYSNLINGRADIIFVLSPSDNQRAIAKRMGKELKLTPIGKEAFVFFANSKNPVNSLTVDEIKGIYAGEITNWKEVGGKKKAIRAFQRPEDSGSQTALQMFMGDTPIMDPPVEDIASLMGTIVDQVSDYKNYNNAIGYTFRYYSTEMVQSSNIRLLKVNEVEPTVETIRSGEYPITNEFYAITAGTENPHVQELIDWIVSAQGQEIVEKTGYVSIE